MNTMTLKFRAWDRNTKTMLYVGDNPSWADTTGKLIDSFEDEDLMQFTGLLDKNGKEIFEGDIVRFEYNWHPAPQIRIGPVIWSEDHCAWWFDKLLLEPTPRRTIEVIGNIYEHPHLLAK